MSLFNSIGSNCMFPITYTSLSFSLVAHGNRQIAPKISSRICRFPWATNRAFSFKYPTASNSCLRHTSRLRTRYMVERFLPCPADIAPASDSLFFFTSQTSLPGICSSSSMRALATSASPSLLKACRTQLYFPAQRLY